MEMNALLRDVLERAGKWPRPAQEELAAIAREIDALVRAEPYAASEEELAAIDEADASGIAGANEVEAILQSLRRA